MSTTTETPTAALGNIPSSTLQIEEGKFYRNGDGNKIGPMILDESDDGTGLRWKTEPHTRWYANDGKISIGKATSGRDLIEPWPEPATPASAANEARITLPPGYYMLTDEIVGPEDKAYDLTGPYQMWRLAADSLGRPANYDPNKKFCRRIPASTPSTGEVRGAELASEIDPGEGYVLLVGGDKREGTEYTDNKGYSWFPVHPESARVSPIFNPVDFLPHRRRVPAAPVAQNLQQELDQARADAAMLFSWIGHKLELSPEDNARMRTYKAPIVPAAPSNAVRDEVEQLRLASISAQKELAELRLQVAKNQEEIDQLTGRIEIYEAERFQVVTAVNEEVKLNGIQHRITSSDLPERLKLMFAWYEERLADLRESNDDRHTLTADRDRLQAELANEMERRTNLYIKEAHELAKQSLSNEEQQKLPHDAIEMTRFLLAKLAAARQPGEALYAQKNVVHELQAQLEVAQGDAVFLESVLNEKRVCFVWPSIQADRVRSYRKTAPALIQNEEPKWREPTAADVGKIVECSQHDVEYVPRTLFAVLPTAMWNRFVTDDTRSNDSSVNWRFARVRA